jgi:hypothetical protein
MAEVSWYEGDASYWCAFCNQEIRHEGFDPVRVDVDAARSPDGIGGAWLFFAHALCVRDAFHPGFAHDIPRESYMPGGAEHEPDG